MIEAFPPIEARVLTAMICDAKALPICNSLETADLVDMRHIVVLWAIRYVQMHQQPMNTDSILDAIAVIAHEQHIPLIVEHVDGKFLADMMQNAPTYSELDTIHRDLQKLRNAQLFRAELHQRNHQALLEWRRTNHG